MKTNSKVLININNLDEINKYKEIGYTNFLFAVKDLSVGYNAFELSDIPTDSYLLINRVFDSKGINIVKDNIDTIKKYKGVIFEDLGVFHLLKDSGIELVWFQNHYATNIESLNYYLTHGCTSAIISNEITGNEIEYLVNNAVSPVILNVFGKNQIMYSRRTLVSNFNKHFNLDNRDSAILNEPVSKNEFLIKENEYGAVIFNNTYFNYIEFSNKLDDSKIKYYLVLNLDYEPNEIKEILDGKQVGDEGFLNRKTVYRLEDYK